MKEARLLVQLSSGGTIAVEAFSALERQAELRDAEMSYHPEAVPSVSPLFFICQLPFTLHAQLNSFSILVSMVGCDFSGITYIVSLES
jgi:hypothetical protein